MSRTRLLLILLSLGALAGGLLAGLRPAPPPTSSEEPRVEISAPTLTKFDEAGRRLWELRARAISLDQQAERTLAEDVRIAFFRDERVTLELTAPRLLLFNESGDLELEGGISAQGEGGLRFWTERMRWDAREAVLRGDLEVEVEKEENRLSGRGFEYSPQEGRFVVEEEAHLILLPGEE
ncbi:MAG: LPS export ABC transporter periplasmic protein LptC [Candidatus Acetothermia bacterium]|jgi:LPS export ABC transporter protein LptC|nr:LPS export ABC transporter periplasmic protein LptC [Candidatus Acetothermia bacterium]MDH7505357.1 LPS export ABC transporter periplasmic protein LptC [Candidatus Acetothermia bacterium]